MPEYSSDRRQFARLPLAEDAVAIDQQGNQLGRVAMAGGGGFLIFPATPQARAELAPGRTLTITVFEPKNNVRSLVDVEVRYIDKDAVGVQFIGNEKKV